MTKRIKYKIITILQSYFTESIRKYDAKASSSNKPVPDGKSTFLLGYGLGKLRGLRIMETVSVSKSDI